MKTMHTLISVIMGLFLISNLNAQEVTFEWVKKICGSESETGNSITTDQNGNILITGEFYDVVDFDPGPVSIFLSSNGARDIFIQKLDPEGNVLWTKQIGGIDNDEGLSITSDINGNVYTSGYFRETVDFDPGTEILNLTSIDDEDIFIQKLDPEGNFLWVKQMGGLDTGKAVSITTDSFGNVYTTGYFQGSIDFDPGDETLNFTSNGGSDIFIQKLDPNGNFLWAKQMGSVNSDRGHSITIDLTGNVYVSGYFFQTIDFDPGPESTIFTSNGSEDIFIQKLDPSGNFIWAKQMGGLFSDECYSITTDVDGNIISTGFFGLVVDFDPNSGTTNLTSNGNMDTYIQKIDGNGNLIWIKQIGGNNNVWGRSIITDSNGNIYSTGHFNETVDFDPGPGTTNLTSNGALDAYIQSLDANGNFNWVIQLGGLGIERGLSISLDINNNLYTTGHFNQTVDFDPSDETLNLTPTGSFDIFIQKLSLFPVSITENTFQEYIQLYPNPSQGDFAVTFESLQEELNIRILSLTGQVLETKTFQSTNQFQMELDQPKGLYFIEIISADGRKMVIRLVKE